MECQENLAGLEELALDTPNLEEFPAATSLTSLRRAYLRPAPGFNILEFAVSLPSLEELEGFNDGEILKDEDFLILRQAPRLRGFGLGGNYTEDQEKRLRRLLGLKKLES